MLTRRHLHRPQQGVVLLLVIIVLVALTLGALALTRSVYTTNVIAGNLAFQRAARNSAERGVEFARQWLETMTGKAKTDCATGGMALYCTSRADGYVALRAPDKAADQSWLSYWDEVIQQADIQPRVVRDIDEAGNNVSYIIQRMCSMAGDPSAANNECTTPPTATAGTCGGGSSCSAGEANLASPTPVYYRITVRVDGPRNTRSMVQAMVAM